jgi:hypothetical protein
MVYRWFLLVIDYLSENADPFLAFLDLLSYPMNI